MEYVSLFNLGTCVRSSHVRTYRSQPGHITDLLSGWKIRDHVDERRAHWYAVASRLLMGAGKQSITDRFFGPRCVQILVGNSVSRLRTSGGSRGRITGGRLFFARPERRIIGMILSRVRC